jgi:hypothetical protein
MSTPPVHLAVSLDTLRPLVTEIVEECLARLEAAKGALPEKMAYSEPEAAQLMGLNVHQLRDERLRGRISVSRVVGNKIRYLHADLVGYLTRNRNETTT